jgi:tRNA (cmo5U34)-methyltransferase
MDRDKLYAEEPADAGSFEFNAAVAAVFPDMLQRSIPGYAASIQAIGTLASRHVTPGTRCYDLGCSLGAATLAMRHHIDVEDCRIIAVDSASAMIAACRKLIEADLDDGPPVTVVQCDVREIEIEQASMVVMNYTLQFLGPAERQGMLQKIADGMSPGGILVLSEKVVDEDAVTEKLLVELHDEFKRRHHYSDLEISRKRAAIENVLVPDSVATHHKRLRTAGFRHVGEWLRNFNFVSFVATK